MSRRSFERTVRKNSKQLNQQRKKAVNQSQEIQVRIFTKAEAFCSLSFNWFGVFVSVHEYFFSESTDDNLGLGHNVALCIFGCHFYATPSLR